MEYGEFIKPLVPINNPVDSFCLPFDCPFELPFPHFKFDIFAGDRSTNG